MNMYSLRCGYFNLQLLTRAGSENLRQGITGFRVEPIAPRTLDPTIAPLDYAPVWRRLLAGFADWVLALIGGAIGGFVAAIAFIIIASILHDSRDGANHSFVGAIFLYIPASFVSATLILLYFAFRSSSRGWTPGHRLLSLRVV